MNTRQHLLSEIDDWLNNSDSKSTLWICGPPGVGKSTLAHTLARNLDKEGSHRLGASFFFDRADARRNNPQSVFPSLAYQLAARQPALREFCCPQSTMSDLKVQNQFEMLISKPLASCFDSMKNHRLVIIVDALDDAISLVIDHKSRA